jgi:hypothetical protein
MAKKNKFHVQVRTGDGKWRSVGSKWKGKQTKQFGYKKAKLLTAKLRKRRGVNNVRMRLVRMGSSKNSVEQAVIAKWLVGDLDATHDLMFRLATVARNLGHTLYVAEGKRSIADQWKYWYAYQRGQGPLAAFPGKSNHTWGKACDVRKYPPRGTASIGDIVGARDAMKRHGLCLPVPGEKWHVEVGTTWRA